MRLTASGARQLPEIRAVVRLDVQLQPFADVRYRGAARGAHLECLPDPDAALGPARGLDLGFLASEPRSLVTCPAAEFDLLAFDRAGRGAIAARCNEALQHAYPPPVIAAWGPKSVTREQAASGFDMYFTGSNLVDGVDVAVAGAALGVMRVEQGRVMTTRIPAGAVADGLVRFTVRHRGRPVLEEAVDVSDAERHSR